MSLDITFYGRSKHTKCFLSDGSEISVERMKEVFPNYKPQIGEVWWRNITHNVGIIAQQVPVSDTLSLYDILWNPTADMFDKSEWKSVQPEDYTPLLCIASEYISKHIEELRAFNAENGWGTADDLLAFVVDMEDACFENPEVESIHISK